MTQFKQIIEYNYSTGKEETRWLSPVELGNKYPFETQGTKAFEGGDGAIYKFGGNAIKVIKNVDINKYAKYKHITTVRQRIGVYQPKIWYYDIKQEQIIQVFQWIEGLNLKEFRQAQDRRVHSQFHNTKSLFMESSWRNNKKAVRVNNNCSTRYPR